MNRGNPHFVSGEAGQGFEGWCAAHASVTATAIRALVQLGLSRSDPLLARATASLLARRDRNGFWEDYWWDDRLYCTARALEALCEIDHEIGPDCQRAVLSWLFELQQDDGSFGNGRGGPGRPLYTAQALGILTGAYGDARSLNAAGGELACDRTVKRWRLGVVPLHAHSPGTHPPAMGSRWRFRGEQNRRCGPGHSPDLHLRNGPIRT